MAPNRKELLEEADREIALFEKWFTGQGKGIEPLARFERAILKTYLVAKGRGALTEPSVPDETATPNNEAVA